MTADINATNHSPMTEIIKITNPAAIIFNASEPETSSKARLVIPVKVMMTARIPRITPDTLCFTAQDMIKLRIFRFRMVMCITLHAPTIGIMNITNPMAIIPSASVPFEFPIR